jgi:virginiamycin B lyase
LLLSLPAVVSAQQVAIGDYPVPTAGSWPQGITAGPDGALWFTEIYGTGVGRITTAGVITEFPTADTRPDGITTGPDGALWFTEDNHVARITTTGVITQYPVDGYPWAITAGPDGALWFTEWIGNKIGRITTSGVITEYHVPTADSAPMSITTGPDGALWFTELRGDKIGRITTAGVIAEYNAGGWPTNITAGPDGALWFTEDYDKIGRITTDGIISEYPVPTFNSCPEGITVGPDGALWFTEGCGNKIGRITTAGVVTEYPVPTIDSGPYGITAGPDGALWFTEQGRMEGTEQGGNKIGELVFVTAGLSVSPASGVYQANLTFTGTAFAPNESVQIYAFGVGSRVLASATADAGGSFTAAAPNPQAVYGHRLFLGVGQSSGKLGAADFSVTPRVILSTRSGTVGSTVVASGVGFGSSETVNVWWNNPPTRLGTATANYYGTFTGTASLTFTVPAGAPLGANKVYAKGQTTGVIVGSTFTVQ